MFFKPKPLIETKQLRVLILFSNSLSVSSYLLSELEKYPQMQDKIIIVGSLTNNIRAVGTKTMEMKNITCRAIDEEMFAKKKELQKNNVSLDYLKKVKDTIIEFKPHLVLSDNFTIESTLVESVFEMPVLETAFVSTEGNKITTFTGENVVRNVILSSKRDLQAGAFITTEGKQYLLVLSRKLPLDLQKLANITNSDEFERYVKIFAEKYIWQCAGPAAKKALELFLEGKIVTKGGKLYIKEGNEYLQGFYNMTTECIQSIYGLKK